MTTDTDMAFERIMAIFEQVAGGRPVQEWQDKIYEVLLGLQEDAISYWRRSYRGLD